MPPTGPSTHDDAAPDDASIVSLDGLWRPIVAGLAGSAAHSAIMFFKSWSGLLPGFHPYRTLQETLALWIDMSVHPAVPWIVSYANGMLVLGFLFRLLYRQLPGQSGAAKGAVFGVIGWLIMGLVFFPLLGLGPFATRIGLGIWPGLFSLAMVLAYSVVLGVVYSILRPARVVEL
jgi:hypothetical protein